jgi:hypothetical protein
MGARETYDDMEVEVRPLDQSKFRRQSSVTSKPSAHAIPLSATFGGKTLLCHRCQEDVKVLYAKLKSFCSPNTMSSVLHVRPYLAVIPFLEYTSRQYCRSGEERRYQSEKEEQ